MNKLSKTLVLSLFTLILFGCQPRDSIRLIDPEEELVFKIKQGNSSDDFSSKSSMATVKSRSSRWARHPNGGIRLIRELLFEVKLENDKLLEFGFWFSKLETNENLLILEGVSNDEDEVDIVKERGWDYISFDEEVSNFYKAYDKGRITVGNRVIFFNLQSNAFKVLNVEKALVNGEEKTYLSAYFGGKAYGVYDCCEAKEFYELINGGFKGVIE